MLHQCAVGRSEQSRARSRRHPTESDVSRLPRACGGAWSSLQGSGDYARSRPCDVSEPRLGDVLVLGSCSRDVDCGSLLQHAIVVRAYALAHYCTSVTPAPCRLHAAHGGPTVSLPRCPVTLIPVQSAETRPETGLLHANCTSRAIKVNAKIAAPVGHAHGPRPQPRHEPRSEVARSSIK